MKIPPNEKPKLNVYIYGQGYGPFRDNGHILALLASNRCTGCINNLAEIPKALTGPIFLNICLNLYLYDGIFNHLNDEILSFFNTMIISEWRPCDFRGWGIKLNISVFFAVKLFFSTEPSADVAGNFFLLDWKDCLG